MKQTQDLNFKQLIGKEIEFIDDNIRVYEISSKRSRLSLDNAAYGSNASVNLTNRIVSTYGTAIRVLGDLKKILKDVNTLDMLENINKSIDETIENINKGLEDIQDSIRSSRLFTYDYLQLEKQQLELNETLTIYRFMLDRLKSLHESFNPAPLAAKEVVEEPVVEEPVVEEPVDKKPLKKTTEKEA